MVRYRPKRQAGGTWSVVDQSIGYTVAVNLTASVAMLMASKLNEGG